MISGVDESYSFSRKISNNLSDDGVTTAAAAAAATSTAEKQLQFKYLTICEIHLNHTSTTV